MHKYDTDQNYIIHMPSCLLGVEKSISGPSDWHADTEMSIDSAYAVVTHTSAGSHENQTRYD